MLYSTFILLSLFVLSAARTFPDLGQLLRPVEGNGTIWALLVAGSAGWGNYRHQADVCHAAQVLLRGGISRDHLIVMLYDDIARNPENPRQGTIINHPQGQDLYQGVPLDYTREAVTAQNFLAVLTGNKTALVPPSSKNDIKFTGRVIEAGPEDRLFIFYSDHGAPGVLGMPSGPFLYADQLHDALKKRTHNLGLKEAVLYIEACESGSIFEGLLEKNTGIYAVTAANGRESSWGTYCPGMDGPQPPPGYNTCLGDLFSVSWMEDADYSDLTRETLKKQFQKVRFRTSSNWTYAQGSHVMHFGQLSIDEEVAANFEGSLNTGRDHDPSFLASHGEGIAGSGSSGYARLPQRDADLAPLRGSALHAEKERRRQLDKAVADAVDLVLKGRQPFLIRRGYEERAQDRVPLVDDWDCLRAMVSTWEEVCGPLGQYGMKNTGSFARLCNVGVQPSQLVAAATSTCSQQAF